MSTGDGATATAPQSTTVLGGKILRIDQNGNAVAGQRVGVASGTRVVTATRRASASARDQRSVLDRARARRRRRGQQAGQRREQRVEPEQRRGDYDQSKPMTDPSVEPASTMTPVWRRVASPSRPRVAPSSAARSGRHGTARSSSRASTAAPRRAATARDAPHCRGTGLVGVAGHRAQPQHAAAGAVQGTDGNLYVVTDGKGGTGAIWGVPT